MGPGAGRVASALVVAALAALIAPAAAWGAVPAPEPDCAITDERLNELSGLAVDGPDRWGIVDSASRSTAYRIDPRTCAVVDTRSAPIEPRDGEDLAIGPDGALWLADIGDNGGMRDSVALVVLPRTGPPRLHRLTYPDGPRDAEALVVGDDGVPLVIAKASGAAGIYRPAGLLGEPGPTRLERVGQVVLPVSSTVGGPLGALGTRTITGAALGPPGAGRERVLALRTYTDAWLFRLPGAADADGLASALAGAPVQIPLPGEPQGEAIALTPDGTLLSGSEGRDGRLGEIRAVPGAAAAATAPDAPTSVPPATPPPAEEFPSWAPAAVGVAAVAVLLTGAAVAMTLHARRRAHRR